MVCWIGCCGFVVCLVYLFLGCFCFGVDLVCFAIGLVVVVVILLGCIALVVVCCLIGCAVLVLLFIVF